MWRHSDDSQAKADLIHAATQPHEGTPLRNAAYRFNRPGESQDPFRNMGKPGHEASDRETIALWQELHDQDSTEPED